MNTTNARKLKHEELTELRKRGVNAVQNGESPEDVARVLGVYRTTIYNWLELYRAGGWDALSAKKRGGRKPKVDSKAMSWLYKAITDKTPEQYKFPFVLWTSKLVARLIEERPGPEGVENHRRAVRVCVLEIDGFAAVRGAGCKNYFEEVNNKLRKDR